LRSSRLGERSGQRALLSVDRFNQLASSGDMNTVLMNAVAAQQPQRPAQPRRRGRQPEIVRPTLARGYDALSPAAGSWGSGGRWSRALTSSNTHTIHVGTVEEPGDDPRTGMTAIRSAAIAS
jgi:hypothetical protein